MNKNNPFDQAQQSYDKEDRTFSATELIKVTMLSEVAKKLQEPKNIFSNTILAPDEMPALGAALFLNYSWEIEPLYDLCSFVAYLKLSKNGIGREQIIKLMIGIGGAKKKGLFSRDDKSGGD